MTKDEIKYVLLLKDHLLTVSEILQEMILKMREFQQRIQQLESLNEVD
jgi:hypothetical protein